MKAADKFELAELTDRRHRARTARVAFWVGWAIFLFFAIFIAWTPGGYAIPPAGYAGKVQNGEFYIRPHSGKAFERVSRGKYQAEYNSQIKMHRKADEMLFEIVGITTGVAVLVFSVMHDPWFNQNAL